MTVLVAARLRTAVNAARPFGAADHQLKVTPQ